MKLQLTDEKAISLVLTSSDLEIISNCLNETLEAIDEWEFPTRVGASVESVEAMLREINFFLSHK